MNNNFAQETRQNYNEFEVGGAVAGAEAFYYGVYSKYNIALTKSKHYLKAGVGLTMYFDFKGESTSQAKLKDDVDMRIIPYFYIGYNFNFNRFDVSLELPIGTSIAITKGTLVNERIGFERTYSNTEYLWHYGLALSTKYSIDNKNKIGLYGFIPMIKDIAWTSPMIGIPGSSSPITRIPRDAPGKISMAPLRSRALRCSSAALGERNPNSWAISMRVGGMPVSSILDLIRSSICCWRLVNFSMSGPFFRAPFNSSIQSMKTAV